MYHLVARAQPGTLLFRTHREARRLFDALLAAFPDAEALCLLPDHVHALPNTPDAGRLGRVMSGFARWRNADRGHTGPVWTPAPPPELLPDEKHERRTVRYVHLNPCRAHLVTDPLAWPWSTHRDAVGLAVPRLREPERDPFRFHRYVSGDPSSAVEGTPLPEGQWGTCRWEEVRDAVAGVCRVSLAALRERGPARTLAIRAARVLDALDAERVAAELGMSPSAVYRAAVGVPPRPDLAREPSLLACVRAVGDPRFYALPEGDLRTLPTWRRYRSRS